MRPLVLILLASTLLAVPTLAHAQDIPAPPAPPPGATPPPVTPPSVAPPPPPETPAPRAAEAPSTPESGPAPAPAPWDALKPLPSKEEEEKAQGHTGFAVNLSVGYAIPFGDATGAPGDSLSATFGGQVPFSLEIGGDLTPSLFLGVYGTYAIGGAGSGLTGCSDSDVSCSAHSFHTGIAIAYRFLPGETIRPWVGYGFGYEWQDLSITNTNSGAGGSLSTRGWEFGHFKAGFDVQAKPTFAFGPFLDIGVGQYDHLKTDGTPQPVDADVTTTALHGWFTIGVRAAIAP